MPGYPCYGILILGALHNSLSCVYTFDKYAMSGFQLPAGFKPSSGPSTGGGSGGQGGPSEEERAAQEQRAQQQADMKRNMISAMLSVEARERCKSASLESRRTELDAGKQVPPDH
jgi:hypothetical protein